eukprot:gene30463-34386_t
MLRCPLTRSESVPDLSKITCIEDLRVIAQRRVPRMFYDYADSGAWTEGTYRANETDFHKIKLRQRVAVNMENRTTATKMVGIDTKMPVCIAPVGLTGMQHADGEMHAAMAAKKFGIPFTLSTMSICSIEDIAAHTQLGKHADQLLDVFAQQRLAAGQAQFLDAMLDEDPGDARDFFKAQQRGMRQVVVVLVEHFLGHAVDAAEIAAVGDGNAQVVQGTGELVPQVAGGRLQDGWHDSRLRAVSTARRLAAGVNLDQRFIRLR